MTDHVILMNLHHQDIVKCARGLRFTDAIQQFQLERNGRSFQTGGRVVCDFVLSEKDVSPMDKALNQLA